MSEGEAGAPNHAALRALARAAKGASRELARAPAARREEAIRAIARALDARRADVLSANLIDLEAGREAGLSAPLLDRLTLTHARLDALHDALLEIAAQPDPVGAVTREWARPNGLRVRRVRLPLGVILMIYESRPNVTLDAAALCLKSGNGAILRGGSEARATNAALFALVAEGLREAGLPPEVIAMVPTQDRGAIDALVTFSEEIDLVIPRGGAGLIARVVERSRIPVVRHDQGICHLYIDAAADLEKATAIAVNAKAQRPGVCNALETLLVDAAVAREALTRALPALAARGVALRLCPAALAALPSAAPSAALSSDWRAQVSPAADADWDTEFLSLTLAVRVVEGLEGAIAHIDAHGSRHTAAIVTEDAAAAERFTREVDASCVLVNASTRFNDGGELGLGAEVGISTTRVHAFGPMGAESLTAEKFVVWGDGQVRG